MDSVFTDGVFWYGFGMGLLILTVLRMIFLRPLLRLARKKLGPRVMLPYQLIEQEARAREQQEARAREREEQ